MRPSFQLRAVASPLRLRTRASLGGHCTRSGDADQTLRYEPSEARRLDTLNKVWVCIAKVELRPQPARFWNGGGRTGLTGFQDTRMREEG